MMQEIPATQNNELSAAPVTDEQIPPIVPWKTQLCDIAILIVGLIIIECLFGYFRPLARPDSISSLETAREILFNHNWITLTLNNAIAFDSPPLFYWLTALSFKVFGYSLFAARFWPGIFGMIGVISLYLFGTWFAGRRMGLACALIATTSMLPLTLMTAASPYIMGSVFITIGLCSIYAAGQTAPSTKRTWLVALFWFTCGLNTLLLGIAGLLLPLTIAIVFFWVMTDTITLKALIFSPKGIFFFLIVTIPWYVVVAQHNPHFLYYFFYQSILLSYLIHFHNALESFLLVIFGLFAAMLPWSLIGNMGYWACRPLDWNSRFEKPLGMFLLVWIFFTSIYLIGIAPTQLFWIGLLTPAFSIALAKALHRWWSTTDKGLFSASKSLIILCLVVLAALFCLLTSHSGDFSLGFVPSLAEEIWLWVVFSIFVIGGVCSYFALKRQDGLKITTWIFLLLGLIGTITFVSALPRLRQDSMQPIVQYIQTHQKKDDVIASYHQYYSEIGFSMQKSPLVVVDWLSPPMYASLYQNLSSWVVTSAFFWQTINQNGRNVYFVVAKSDMSSLSGVIQDNHLRSVAENGQVVLLTNAAES
ncbi:MAG: hypothetical protein HKM04_11645 [Legionellales bacterium]|nr:hypothetical protein [Legionellales bacterium]